MPAAGSTFSGWSGPCTGTGTCSVTMTAAKTITATFAATTPSGGLAVSYGFNEGSGTTAADSSGNGKTGSVSGATWTTQGKFGSALTFNGGAGKVLSGVTTHALQRTYMLWTKRQGPGGNGLGRLFDKRTSGAEVEGLYYDSSAGVYRYFRVWSGGVGAWTIPAPSANVWHHITVAYNAGSAANNPQIYVDGVAQAVRRATNPSGTPLANTDAYVVGNRGTDNARGWSGQLDEVRIYNRLLTVSEIQSAMNTAVAAP